ncbi:hypothetical protein COCNU_01G006400 [Cocos nucifera]|uniref:Uncharacterized protein n=1 Tax=Cocos nucifera TaxID=13894 RepID=A0A8K0HU47_COCNU|nr:hypothetical protein COCNU_01G006400 [Cocos nucifera]
MASPARSSPVAFSGGAASTGDDSYLVLDPNSQTGSAAGSFQGEGLLAGTAGGALAADGGSGGEVEFGFQRPEFGRQALVGTVQIYDRHVFLCYKSPDVWPSHVEAAESDRLPRLLFAALKARKGEMKKRDRIVCDKDGSCDTKIQTNVVCRKLNDLNDEIGRHCANVLNWMKTRLTICEGEDGTDSSNGDVLIFPDMIRYRYGYVSPDDVPTLLEQHIGKGKIVDHLWR